ncbi:NUDIX hydrolase [Chelativorans sp. Marseille-P2723]|uniref:NUDIX hydrolase n=1 Tax=Chelativorans sp. Marseille-P2723 TaxID=2709133 RepID=UPI00156EA8F8|nr:NUDIX hydrolase [Chelativorans sp. Marseille-P2723]
MFVTARTHFLERLRRLFGGNPPRVQAAALPFRQGQDGLEILLITSRGTGRWILPKGWPEGQETLGETAAREALEEAGVEGAMGGELGRYLYGKEMGKGMRWRCEVAVFPLKVEREATSWPESGKRVRAWVDAQEAARRVAEPDLAALIAAFADNPREIAA